MPNTPLTIILLLSTGICNAINIVMCDDFTEREELSKKIEKARHCSDDSDCVLLAFCEIDNVSYGKPSPVNKLELEALSKIAESIPTCVEGGVICSYSRIDRVICEKKMCTIKYRPYQ